MYKTKTVYFERGNKKQTFKSKKKEDIYVLNKKSLF